MVESTDSTIGHDRTWDFAHIPFGVRQRPLLSKLDMHLMMPLRSEAGEA